MKANIIKIIFICIILSMVIPAINGYSKDTKDRHCRIFVGGRECVYNPSMIELIANAEKYHEKKVLIKGYLNLEFEGDAIYTNEEDYKAGLTKNSIWVDIDRDKLTERQLDLKHHYVLIEGTFDAYSMGHMSLSSGTIKDITRLDKGLTLSDIAKIRSNK